MLNEADIKQLIANRVIAHLSGDATLEERNSASAGEEPMFAATVSRLDEELKGRSPEGVRKAIEGMSLLDLAS